MTTQDIEAALVDGNGAETGHIIVTTIGGKNGQPKQVSTGYCIGTFIFLFIIFCPLPLNQPYICFIYRQSAIWLKGLLEQAPLALFFR